MSTISANEAAPSLSSELEAPRKADVEAGQPEKESEESTLKKINWDVGGDALNPMTWSNSKKWSNMLVISLMSFSTPLASSMFAPAVPQAMKDLHSTSTQAETWVVSIFILGFAIGPLFVAPFSEIYGRRIIYIISNFLFVIFTVACGLSTNIGMLIGFRFLAGCAGSTPQTLGGASIGDMFTKETRGGAMALYGLGPLLGPTLGPVMGGYLSEAEGWKWIFWLQSIISGTSLILGIIFLRETYAVIILERKTQKLIQSTGNKDLVSILHDNLSIPEHFRRAIIRPGKMLFFSPTVFLLSIFTALVFGYLYVFVTTFPLVFQGQYHFSAGSTGLAYLGLGTGMFIGLLTLGKSSDKIYQRLTARNQGIGKPEFRLPPVAATAPLIAISFFWYGWSTETRVHWIVPIIGTSFFGIGIIPTFLSINLYLVETYTIHAASAIAATKILQSIGGAVFPLAGPPLYNLLGLGWGNSVLAFIALAFFPVPWLFYRYGELLRSKSKVKF